MIRKGVRAYGSLMLSIGLAIGLSVNASAATKYADFNGDGYSDLASGLPLAEVYFRGAGAVRIIYGNALNGLFYDPMQYLAQGGLNIPGVRATDNHFGASVAAGDFNGDGYSDLAVGSPGYDYPYTDCGAIVLLFGSPTGLLGKQEHIYFGTSSGEQFGSVLTAADLNGDGKDEVIAGMPDRRVGAQQRAGAVRIFRGAAAGVLTEMALITQNNLPNQNAQANDEFGFSLRAGDFNNDGHLDLAIGAPGEDWSGKLDSGVVHILYGSANGPVTSSAQLITQNASGNETGDRFGSVIATGNFGYGKETDIAISTPYEDIGSLNDAGAVFVFYGSPSGLTGATAQVFTQDTPGITDAPETGDHFGYSLSAGQFKGGPYYSIYDPLYDALAIGVPDETITYTKQGAVHVLSGSSEGLTTAAAQFLTHADFGTFQRYCWDPAGSRMGVALGAVDSGGSSESDLVVGGEQCQGEIYTYKGGPSGLMSDYHIRGEYWSDCEQNAPCKGVPYGFGLIITGH